MTVAGRQAEAVVQRHQIAIIAAERRVVHDPVSRRLNRLAESSGYVQAGVKVGVAVEWVAPVAVPRRDPSGDRPDRWSGGRERLSAFNPGANGLESLLENAEQVA